MWLTQFDRGELSNEEVEAALVADYEAKIAALERKVGELRKTRNLDVQDRFHNPCGAIFSCVFRIDRWRQGLRRRMSRAEGLVGPQGVDRGVGIGPRQRLQPRCAGRLRKRRLRQRWQMNWRRGLASTPLLKCPATAA